MITEPETNVLGGEGEWLQLPGLRLTVIEGPDRGRETLAHSGVVRVGSAPDNDLVLTDPAVSRRHLRIRLRLDEVHVCDLDSTNGTRVDGVRIMEAVLSPASLIRVGDTIIRANAAEESVVVPVSPRTRFGDLRGESTPMRAVFAVLERVARTDATVLIGGETGTGKELAAEAIHAHSPRAEGPFVVIDCGAIAPSLVESELFGHVRGAFTGATSDRRGVFEEAHGGTLFLDEIGDLPLELQPKLLRVLDKREVRRVGSSELRKVDARIIAATHRDLAAQANKGGFREDLYFRLAVVQVTLPPLRARREDVPMLVRQFVKELAPDAAPLSGQITAALAARSWPGNVRELRNAVERAVAMAEPAVGAGVEALSGEEVGFRQVLQSGFGLPFKEGLRRWTERYERAYLEHLLHLSDGSVSGAARIAGVNRRFIQRLMRRHGMQRGDAGA